MVSKNSFVAGPVREAEASRTGLKSWLKLLIGFALVWVCIFVFGTLSRYIPGADHMAEVIDERGLRATAIYYTDLEETYEGSEYIRHALESAPNED